MYKALFLHSLLKDFYNFFSSVCLWWIQLEWMYPCDSSWRACLFIFLGEICGKELLGHRAGVSSVYVSGTATCFPIWNLLAFEIPDQTVCLIICSLIKHSLLFFFLCLGRAIVKKQVHLFTPPYIHTLGNIIWVVPSFKSWSLSPTPWISVRFVGWTHTVQWKSQSSRKWRRRHPWKSATATCTSLGQPAAG